MLVLNKFNNVKETESNILVFNANDNNVFGAKENKNSKLANGAENDGFISEEENDTFAGIDNLANN
jgi:hypothetical protein